MKQFYFSDDIGDLSNSVEVCESPNFSDCHIVRLHLKMLDTINFLEVWIVVNNEVQYWGGHVNGVNEMKKVVENFIECGASIREDWSNGVHAAWSWGPDYKNMPKNVEYEPSQ